MALLHRLPLLSSRARHFCSLPKLPKLPKLREIPSKYRPLIVLQAQQALTDYLHTTQSLHFTHAEHITKNALFSLSNLISQVQYSHRNFSKDFIRFLRYHPINEFEFFLESIGIPFQEIEPFFLPSTAFFLIEKDTILKAVHVLVEFGFPWNNLGMLYKEEISIFGKDSKALKEKLYGFTTLGFDASSVVGICLAFPFVLSENDEMSKRVGVLFEILKRVFLDYDMKSSVQGSYGVCRQIQIFIELGCHKDQVGELMGKNWNVFVECSEEVLVQKVGFFLRLNAEENEVGMLLLRCPEILQYDLDNPKFSVMDFLKQFGLSDKEQNGIADEYPHVLGKNKLANLPHLLRALDLHKWFFNKLVNGDHYLLASFDIGCEDEKLENDFKNFLERIQTRETTKFCRSTMNRLNFLLGIGFGENLITIRVVSHMHGSSNQLQERFSYLLDAGVEFCKLLKMIKVVPMILNLGPELLKEKLNFLRYDIGESLQYLEGFTAYLCFDLENRIKPRYRIHVWLKENGFPTREYSVAYIVGISENRFMAHLLRIHPTTLKQWLERFSPQNYYYCLQEE